MARSGKDYTDISSVPAETQLGEDSSNMKNKNKDYATVVKIHPETHHADIPKLHTEKHLGENRPSATTEQHSAPSLQDSSGAYKNRSSNDKAKVGTVYLEKKGENRSSTGRQSSWRSFLWPAVTALFLALLLGRYRGSKNKTKHATHGHSKHYHPKTSEVNRPVPVSTPAKNHYYSSHSENIAELNNGKSHYYHNSDQPHKRGWFSWLWGSSGRDKDDPYYNHDDKHQETEDHKQEYKQQREETHGHKQDDDKDQPIEVKVIAHDPNRHHEEHSQENVIVSDE